MSMSLKDYKHTWVVESLWQILCVVEIRGLHLRLGVAQFFRHFRMTFDRSRRTFSRGLLYFLLHIINLPSVSRMVSIQGHHTVTTGKIRVQSQKKAAFTA